MLAQLSQATLMLAECKTIDEAMYYRNIAEAARHHAKVSGLGVEASNHATELKLRSERLMGKMLKSAEKNKGTQCQLNGRDSSGGTIQGTARNDTPTLADLGVSKKQSSIWQSIAAIPEPVFEQHVAETKARKTELTSASVLTIVKDIQQEESREKKTKTAQNLPPKIFNVIYADPPWKYNNTGVHGAAQHHYETMDTEKLKTLLIDIEMKVAKDAVLFLWVTNPLLLDAVAVVEAWGFEYKTNMVWAKTELQKPGGGFYVRGRHELLFICTRGNFTPLDIHIAPPIGSIIEAPVREHSRKPESVYGIIEALYPKCNYVELFARYRRNNWDSWGNQVDSFVEAE